MAVDVYSNESFADIYHNIMSEVDYTLNLADCNHK